METITKFWSGTALLHTVHGSIPWMPEGTSISLPDTGSNVVNANKPYVIIKYHINVSRDTVTTHIQVTAK